jgi:hypothetical protein
MFLEEYPLFFFNAIKYNHPHKREALMCNYSLPWHKQAMLFNSQQVYTSFLRRLADHTPQFLSTGVALSLLYPR